MQIRTTRAALAVLLTAVATGAAPGVASANESDWCGRLVASGVVCTGPAYTSWTYTSGKYYGGGSIFEFVAQMYGTSTGRQYYTEFYSNNTTFISGCWFHNGGLGSNFGGIRQSDGGASHTIYGHSDNSSTHTGCVEAFPV